MVDEYFEIVEVGVEVYDAEDGPCPIERIELPVLAKSCVG